MAQETTKHDSLTTLVAIIFAARNAADRHLEREMRRQLEQRFGVRLHFPRAERRQGRSK